MARMLETLNQPTLPAYSPPTGISGGERPVTPPPAEVAREAESVAVEPEPEPEPDLDEEIPYIEVGPQRSIEGSPGVMLSLPRPRPIAVPEPEPPATIPLPANRSAIPRLVPAPTLPLANSVEEKPASSAPLAFRPAADRPVRGQATFGLDLIAYHAAGQPASVPYRELLGQILGAQRNGKERRVLFFTAGRSEAGTTTVVLNLAITAALQGRSALVVDANLRRPGVALRLGLGEVPGLREVLAGHFGAEEVVRPTGLTGLEALTSGPLAGPARLTISAEKVDEVLAECKQNHDLVFVDGSRWDGRPDVTAFGSAADAVYLVVASAEVDTPAIEGLTQLIPEQGGSLAGSILVGR